MVPTLVIQLEESGRVVVDVFQVREVHFVPDMGIVVLMETFDGGIALRVPKRRENQFGVDSV
jgi:hypothetical protein